MRLALEPNYFRRLLGIFGTILAIYVVFLALLVVMQRQLMYFPDDVRFNPAAYSLNDFTPLTYTTGDGFKLHGFYAPPKSPHKLTIVFFQGNAGNLGMRVDKIKRWREAGYGVMLATYRGFEGNPGSPTEPGLYLDARAAIDALKAQGANRPNMIFYGESLGSGVAVQMATEGAAAGVILEVPYTSIPDVGAYRYPFVPIFWMLWDRYESINKIKNVHAPILILQAGKDHVIPPVFARKLFDAAPAPKKIVTNPDAGHNNIYSTNVVVNSIFDFLNQIEQPPAASVPAASPLLQQPVARPAPPVILQPAPVKEKAVRRKRQ